SQLTDYLRERGELTDTSIVDLLDKKDRREYPASLAKNIQGMAKSQKPSGVAGAVSKFLETLNPDSRTSEFEIFAPLDCLVQNRTLSGSTPNLGGLLIGTDVWPVELLLRPLSLFLKLGATLVTGLKGNVVLPRQLTEATPYSWLAEQDSCPVNDETFG